MEKFKLTARLLSLMAMIMLGLTAVIGSFTFFANKANALISEDYYTHKTLNFNYDWDFAKGFGKINSGSAYPESAYVNIPNGEKVYGTYDSIADSYTHYAPQEGQIWERVSLPHTYNDIDTFDSLNIESVVAGERSMYSGTAWYTKNFTVPNDYANKRIVVEFEAARQTARVFINGTMLNGHYQNGFIAFGYDITDYIKVGESNNITVLVDNSFPYYADGTRFDPETGIVTYGTTSPIVWHDSHWQPNYGGLYRNVYLHVMDNVQFTLPLYSFLNTQGTYVYTSNETADSATVHIDTQVANFNAEARDNITLVARVKDHNGNVVTLNPGTSEQTQLLTYPIASLPANATGEQSYSINLSAVIGSTSDPAKRWSTEYPYTYTVECALVENYGSNNQIILDNNSNVFGIRTLTFTQDQGFFLNGNYLYLNGWGQKSTNEWAGLGAAYPDYLQEYVMKKMKDAGGNFVRWGHTAGAKGQINACDKLGMLVLQPGVDGEGDYEGSYSDTTLNLRCDAFRDMIIQFRNHPSIIAWELGNREIPSNYAQILKSHVLKYDYGNRNNATLTEKIKNSGTWSNATQASTRASTVREGGSQSKPYCDISVTTQGGNTMSGLPQIEGEYNRYEARRGFLDNSTEGFYDYVNDAKQSGYANVSSETFAVKQAQTLYDYLKSKGVSHSGGANWIFSDSNSHGRLSSEVCRASGEVDAMMLEKESYYACKVLYDTKISGYLIGHWNYADLLNRTVPTKTVYAVTTAYQAKLFLRKTDGTIKVLGNGIAESCVVSFPKISWEEGTVFIQIFDSKGNVYDKYGNAHSYIDNLNPLKNPQISEDFVISQKSTHGIPTKLRLTPVVSTEINHTLLATGQDVLLLDVELLDANDNLCASYDGYNNNNAVIFTLSDGTLSGLNVSTAKWVGGYNSALPNTTFKQQLYLEAGKTRIAIKTTRTAGNITVGASMSGVAPASYTATSANVDNTNGYSTVFTSSAYAYPLDISKEVVVGSNEKSNSAGNIQEKPTSAFVDDVTILDGYTDYSINPFVTGKYAYLDSSIKFVSIPNELIGCEYIQYSNSNRGLQGLDIFTANVKTEEVLGTETILSLILWDSNIPVGSWLAAKGYQHMQGYMVTTTTGTIYKVYSKTLAPHSDIVLGDNGPNCTDGYMYIPLFMKTSTFLSKQQGEVAPNFDNEPAVNPDSTDYTAPLTWDANSITAASFNQNFYVRVENFNNEKVLHIYENTSTTSFFVYAYKDCGVLTLNNTIDFDIYLNNNVQSTFGKVILNSQPFDRVNKDANIVGELQFKIPAANGNLTLSATVPGGQATTRVANTNTWIKIRIKVDFQNQNLKMYQVIDGVETPISSAATYNGHSFSNAATQITGLTFMTSGNGGGGNMFIKNLDIKSTNSLNSITINQEPFTAFNVNTKEYYLENVNLGENSISVDITDTIYASYEITYNKNGAVLTLIDNSGNSSVYKFYTNSLALIRGINGMYINDAYYHTANPTALNNLYKGQFLYTDSQLLFESIPFRIAGADYFMTPSSDYDQELSVLYSFSVNKDTYVYILRPIECGLPAWADGFYSTGEIAVDNDGNIYMLYQKLYKAGSAVKLGGNCDDFAAALYNKMQIVAVKSVSDTQSQVFFDDDFEHYNTDEAGNMNPVNWIKDEQTEGAVAIYEPNAIITNENGEEVYDSLITLDDNIIADGALVTATKSFGKQNTNFEISVKFKITDRYAMGSLKFIRIWITNGIPKDYLDKTNTLIETYLHSPDGINLYLIYKPYAKANGMQDYYIMKGITLNDWHTLTYYVNFASHTFMVKLDNGNYVSQAYASASMSGTTKILGFNEHDSPENCDVIVTDEYGNAVKYYNQANAIHFGTGANGNAKLQVSRISINPINYNCIDGIKLQDNSTSQEINISHFDVNTGAYIYYLNTQNDLPTISPIKSEFTVGEPIVEMAANKRYCKITAVGAFQQNSGSVDQITRIYYVYFIANKTQLKDLLLNINEQGTTVDDFTTESWANFLAALNNATEVNGSDTEIYYTNVTSAYTQLRTALNSLEINRSELEQIIARFDEIKDQRDSYTPESFDKLKAEIDLARPLISVGTLSKRDETLVAYNKILPLFNKLEKIKFTITKPANIEVSVTRNSQNTMLNDGDAIYKGEQLLISYNLNAEERIINYTVNGTLLYNNQIFTVNDSDVIIIFEVGPREVGKYYINYPSNITAYLFKGTSNEQLINSGIALNTNDEITFVYELGTGAENPRIYVNGAQLEPINNEYKYIITNTDCTVTYEEDRITYNIVVSEIANGNIEINKTAAKYGDNVKVAILPDVGYELVSLSLNDQLITLDQNGSFVMPAKDVVLSAVFDLANYTISLRKPNNGTASIIGSNEAHYGDTVALSVSPSIGYKLSGLMLNGIFQPISNQNNVSFVMPAHNVVMTAIFEPIQYKLVFSDSAINKVQAYSLNGNDKTYFVNGSSISIENGIILFNWENITGKDIVVLVNGVRFENNGAKNIDSDIFVTYEEIPAVYKVTYTNGNLANVTGTAPTQTSLGHGVSFNVAENTFSRAGKKFVGWNDGTNTYKPNDNYTINGANVTFTSVWEDLTYRITFPEILNVSTTRNGSVVNFNYGDTVNAGEILTITVTVPDGYTFSSLVINSTVYTELLSSYTFTVPENTDVEILINLSSTKICNLTIPEKVTINYYNASGVLQTATATTVQIVAGTSIIVLFEQVEGHSIRVNLNEFMSLPNGGTFVIVEDLTLIYDITINSYWYEYRNWDGSLLESGSVNYGATIPSCKVAPTKSADMQYTYKFIGWDASYQTMPAKNVVFVARYQSTAKLYNVSVPKNPIGYTITPSLSTQINYGEVFEFTVTLDSHYHVDNLVVKANDITLTGNNNVYSVNIYTDTKISVLGVTPNTYTIIFVSDGETYLETQQVYNTTLALPFFNPTKASTAQYDYTFTGWSGYTANMKVAGNATFTAEFVSTERKYTIKFMNGNTEFHSYEATYDSIITLPTTDPTKESTAQYDYTFTSWNGYTADMKVTGNATFNAEFSSTVRKYTITFMFDDTQYHSYEADYGSAITLPTTDPTKESTAQYDYTFTGWSGYTADMKVTGNATFIAEFDYTVKKYVVTFMNGDTQYLSYEADYGSVITLPTTNPTKESTAQYDYTFTSWSGYTADMKVTGNVTFTAEFVSTDRKYLIKFMNGNTEFHSYEANYDSIITLPTTDPTKESTAQYDFTFTGWSGYTENMKVNGNVTFYAEFSSTLRKYTITFMFDDTQYHSYEADYGSVITLPTTDPTKESTAQYDYTFTGWSGYTVDMKVNGNATFTAEFDSTVRLYEIKYMNGDVVFKTYNIAYGETIQIPNETPKKAETETLRYEFLKWSPDVNATMIVENAMNFTAVYKEINLYTISISATENGTVSSQKTVAESGELVSLTITPATNYKLLKVLYINNSVSQIITDNSFVMPAGNVTVKAFFGLTAVESVTDENLTTITTQINPEDDVYQDIKEKFENDVTIIALSAKDNLGADINQFSESIQLRIKLSADNVISISLLSGTEQTALEYEVITEENETIAIISGITKTGYVVIELEDSKTPTTPNNNVIIITVAVVGVTIIITVVITLSIILAKRKKRKMVK